MTSSSTYDVIVLSPHLDDGVLSCGAQLDQVAKAGGRALVATFFTADMPNRAPTPFAQQVLRYMQLDSVAAMAARRAEDEAACAVLGVDWLHIGAAEAICRTISSGSGQGLDSEQSSGSGQSTELFPYRDVAKLFGKPHPQDAAKVIPELITSLQSLPAANRWLVPLGIGGHVDHRLLRQAAERAVSEGGCESVPLRFYEDFPYTIKLRKRLRVLGWPGLRTMKPETVQLTDDNLEQKVEAIAQYTSQIEPLFGGRAGLSRAVRRYAGSVGGERVWRLGGGRKSR